MLLAGRQSSRWRKHVHACSTECDEEPGSAGGQREDLQALLTRVLTQVIRGKVPAVSVMYISDSAGELHRRGRTAVIIASEPMKTARESCCSSPRVSHFSAGIHFPTLASWKHLFYRVVVRSSCEHQHLPL